MPGFAFTDLQLVTALAIEGIVPVPGSPLRMLPDLPRSGAPGDPEFDQLVDLGFVRAGEGRWIVNAALAAVLRAAADPDELIDIGFSRTDIPGVTIVRQGELLFECTIGVGATVTKIYFPLTREAVLARVLEMFSGDRPLDERVGFHFVGTGAEVFALGAVLRRLRTDLRPCRFDELPAVLAADATQPHWVTPIDAMAGPGTVAALVADPAAVRSTLAALVAGGHLLTQPDGTVDMAPATEVLDGAQGPTVALSRAEKNGDGRLVRSTLQVMRCGGRLVIFRRRTPAGAPPLFEWAEVDRVQLRCLAASYVLAPEQLDALLSLGA